jgi:hypothetical protein
MLGGRGSLHRRHLAVQRAPHRHPQVAAQDGLVDHVAHANGARILWGDGLAEARRDHNRQVRPDGQQALRKLRSLEARHALVQQRHVELTRINSESLVRLLRIRKTGHAVAQLLQQLGPQHDQGRLVVHHEHALVAAHAVLGGQRRGAILRRGPGQVDPDRRALPGRALRRDDAADGRHDAVHHRKAQPRPLPDVLGGEEGVENALQGLRVHPRPRVRHRDEGVVPGHHVALPGRRAVGHGQRLHPHLHRAARLAHGVHGIGAQVEHGLVQLKRIGQHHAHLRVLVVSNLEVGRARHPQQAQHLLDDQVGVHRREILLRLPAEQQDLPDQLLGAVPGLVNLLEVAPVRRVVGNLAQRQLGVA